MQTAPYTAGNLTGARLAARALWSLQIIANMRVNLLTGCFRAEESIPLATKAATKGNLKRDCSTAKEHSIPMARYTRENLEKGIIIPRGPLPILINHRR